MKEDRVKSAMTKKPEKKSEKKSGKKGKKHVHRMTIRHAANGGYVAQHDFKNDAGEPPVESEEHVVPDLAALQAHVGDHMEPQPQEGGGEPAPAPAM